MKWKNAILAIRGNRRNKRTKVYACKMHAGERVFLHLSATFGLAGSTPLADFSVDPEDLIYKYLGTNWSISSPTHITKAATLQDHGSSGDD